MKTFLTVALLFITLLVLLPTPAVAALDSPVGSEDTPVDDITDALDAIPAHLGIAPFVVLVVELLKRYGKLPGGKATWVARGIGAVLYVLTVALPPDVLADVLRIAGGIAAFGWSLLGPELYDYYKASTDAG